MSVDRKSAAGIVPAMALAVTVAMMPPAQHTAIAPAPELRPKHGPVEVRTPSRRSAR